MEDFLKFLLIAGVILVGIFKEVSKNSKSKKATDKRPVPPIPSPTEIEPDAVPMPEAWGKIELPIPKKSSKQASRHAPKQQQQKKKREEVSVAASLANSAAQDELNSRQGSHFNTPNESSDNNGDFTIHSAEEARRAIIWGEILQRKY
ncbi:ferrichrome ABC transporter substrate-binding protein [uncultured Bacteroides sp.]|jgi:cytoskeletal protein RodZ|uniref:ferrichrome ABC transporter substrate-binding protein n=1 Tax=uncultured Bacteroides sp. TaxID=162156 RepID=UPI002590C2CC|nr:ferrichrome ABC transporter substrate-binding protein [uncultured Bacteroides sp.]